ncbi:DUF4386 domain-containing protein [Hyphobacterium sp.]|uniref:DUF4386 domain-containing protein n=1 Tax=Hyphobacterium sp. TaxID=2004662 RepID=UPI003BAC7B78
MVSTPPSRAALIVGTAFVVSVLLVTLVDDFLLANFVVPGNTEALASDIENNPVSFWFASIGYLIVLGLDTIIGLGLFIVLRVSNKTLAGITSALRVLYAGVLIVGVLALLFEIIDAYGYAAIKSVGYVLFALHVLVLGYSVIKSGYIPKVIGMFLVLASFTYILFFVDIEWSGAVALLIMLIMAGAELVLCVWLVVKRNSLPESAFLPATR